MDTLLCIYVYWLWKTRDHNANFEHHWRDTNSRTSLLHFQYRWILHYETLWRAIVTLNSSYGYEKNYELPLCPSHQCWCLIKSKTNQTDHLPGLNSKIFQNKIRLFWGIEMNFSLINLSLPSIKILWFVTSKQHEYSL